MHAQPNQNNRSPAPHRDTQCIGTSLADQLYELRVNTVLTVNRYWPRIESYARDPQSLDPQSFVALRAELGKEWGEIQRRFSEIESTQTGLSLTARALVDDLWHEAPKVFLHGPLEAMNWSDTTHSLAGILTNIFLLRDSVHCLAPDQSNFLSSISRDAVLAAGKLDPLTFDSILKDLSSNQSDSSTDPERRKPYTLASFFCKMIEEDYAGNAAASVTCSVEPEYERRVLHKEFASLAKFVLPILIKNAIDAVAVKPPEDRRISISLTPREDQWHIVVADNGPGLPPDVLSRLFTRGVSSHGEGRGYGLELAYRFINGTDLFERALISLLETSANGTSFEIILQSPRELHQAKTE